MSAHAAINRGNRLLPWLARKILRAIGDPPIRLVLPDGTEVTASDGPPVAWLRVDDRSTLLRLVVNPDLNFGDAYAAGRIKVEGDLLEFLKAVYSAMSAANKSASCFRRAVIRPLRQTRGNTLRASRHNVHHHYDLSNDFYRLWLDDEMLYTCAYFPDPAMTLEQAQLAKMDLVCRKLWLKPGESVVEAGSGWGALALYMARHYGVTVKSFNISRRQVFYARERAKVEGLDDRVEFIDDDYRNISGRFDVFVSVGMLEHVGRRYYRQLGGVIDRCLAPDGRALMHSIGRDRPEDLSPWIKRRIFPGAYPPALSEMMDVVEPFGLSVLDVENLRLHYARTLQHWLKRFEAVVDTVRDMFDERFVRTWRLYLTGSIAAFTTGHLQLFQLLLARSGVNTVPWTRERLYRELASSLTAETWNRATY